MPLLLMRYILKAGMRDKLLIGFLVLLGVAMSLSIFLGSSAITEKEQFSLVFMASTLRIGGLITLILFIIFYVRRSFEGRDVEYLLSRPMTRAQFLLGHFLAFAVIGTILSGFITLALFFMPNVTGQGANFLWGVSIWAEYMMMMSMAVFFAFVLSSPVMATLMSLAFYVLARLIGEILGIIQADNSDGMMALMEKMMLLISILVPRLDLMGQSSWLVYGVQDSISLGFILLQGSVFCGLVYFATLIDLNRKEF